MDILTDVLSPSLPIILWVVKYLAKSQRSNLGPGFNVLEDSASLAYETVIVWYLLPDHHRNRRCVGATTGHTPWHYNRRYDLVVHLGQRRNGNL